MFSMACDCVSRTKDKEYFTQRKEEAIKLQEEQGKENSKKASTEASYFRSFHHCSFPCRSFHHRTCPLSTTSTTSTTVPVHSPLLPPPYHRTVHCPLLPLKGHKTGQDKTGQERS